MAGAPWGADGLLVGSFGQGSGCGGGGGDGPGPEGFGAFGPLEGAEPGGTWRTAP